MLFQMVQRTFEQNESEMEVSKASRLLLTVLENCMGTMGALIVPAVTITIKRLSVIAEKTAKVRLLNR